MYANNYDINDFALGLDLGQARDYSALSIVQRTIKADPQRSGAVVPDELKFAPPVYHLLHLQRWPLHSSYVEVCRDVKDLLHEVFPGNEKKPYVVIDYVGPGRVVLDMFKENGILPIGIHTSGAGDTIKSIAGGYSAPKRDLVGVLTAAFQKGDIKIPPDLPNLKILLSELSTFKIKLTKSGSDTFEHEKASQHDDTVMSLALAVYWLYLLRHRADSRHSMIGAMHG
jgi:hypothetical protein